MAFDDIDSINTLLDELSLDPLLCSISKIKKGIRADGRVTFKCLCCSQHFERMPELVTHMRKRQHFFSKKELAEDRQELKERVGDRPKDQWTQAELETFVAMAFKEAHLVRTR